MLHFPEYAPMCSSTYSSIVIFISYEFVFYDGHMIYHVIGMRGLCNSIKKEFISNTKNVFIKGKA